MKINHTSRAGVAVRACKNDEFNGYRFVFDNDDNHSVHVWWNPHVRSWYAAVHSTEDYQIGTSEFCYCKEDIIDSALSLVDQVIDGSFEQI